MSAPTACRTSRIRDMVAFALNLCDAVGVDPTECSAQVARSGRWSSLSLWFETPADMHAFIAALCPEGEGKHGKQPDSQLVSWSRDAYGVAPLLPGEPTMYVRLVAHDTAEASA